ncbi:hypothetical protein D3C86_1149280 [compost metagenome]
MRAKLEDKAYTNAKLYYDLGGAGANAVNYQSAVIALKNAQIDFPDIKYAEEMDLLIIKSQYEYARNSYEIRQEDRFNEAIAYADEFIEVHPQSKLLPEANSLKKASQNGIEKAKTFLAEVEKNQTKYKALLEKDAKRDSITTKTPIK